MHRPVSVAELQTRILILEFSLSLSFGVFSVSRSAVSELLVKAPSFTAGCTWVSRCLYTSYSPVCVETTCRLSACRQLEETMPVPVGRPRVTPLPTLETFADLERTCSRRMESKRLWPVFRDHRRSAQRDVRKCRRNDCLRPGSQSGKEEEKERCRREKKRKRGREEWHRGGGGD